MVKRKKVPPADSSEKSDDRDRDEAAPDPQPRHAQASVAPADSFPIVGIGASAGGLAALKRLFAHVPPDSGFAYVVVVHLAPEHKSHLPELLQPHVPMPVQQVTETVSLQRNRVYVIPPNANLDAIDTHLRVTELELQRRERAPIDHFFRTLAESYGAEAIGVILTGTGHDGTLGLREIKEHGGLTIVQDPNEAEYDGMPQSAIATGSVDLVLPLAQIPKMALQYMQTRPNLPLAEEDEELNGDVLKHLQKVFAQIRARTGRDVSRYKRSTILRRIHRRMQILQIEEVARYLDMLRERPDEVMVLADDLLITVTSFFRDPHVFEKLAEEVIPLLFAGKGTADDIRVWSVGCTTGEEAYSLAMLLLEESARHEFVPKIQIFATDLHQPSLKKAREGLYPGDIEADVSPERLSRFFTKENGSYRMRKEVRELVLFAPHNLISDPPFSRLDLISCRNLLIYIQRDAQREVLDVLHYSLRPDGFLFIGTSETVDATHLFQVMDKKSCVYRKRNVVAPEPRLQVFPLTRSRLQEDTQRTERAIPAAAGAIHQRLVERYAPPSALISPEDTVVHLSEHAGRYLVHSGGELTASVFKLLREELRLELHSLLHAAREHRQAKRSKPIHVRFNGESAAVVLHVRPSLEAAHEGYVLVIFDEWEQPRFAPIDESPGLSAPAVPEDRNWRERELEAELEATRQRLQVVIREHEMSQEEMHAANEEMQSTNEELRSTMEELETSKEELQSMNEELQTVNQENRHRVEELSQLSSDLQNLMAATGIATLFLDRQLRIMRFTPKVGELFNIRVTDRGRPITDLTHRLGYGQLSDDADLVLRQLVPVEREVSDQSGHAFLTRLMPYRSIDDRIEGIVITFVDITTRKVGEELVREARDRAERELAVMTRFHALVDRLLQSADLKIALEEVLLATVEIMGTSMGTVQIMDLDSGSLELLAHHGFDDTSVERFRHASIDDGTCSARAVRSGKRVVAEDVLSDPFYQSRPDIVSAAGYRAVQSTPLQGRGGEVLGVLCTYHAQPCRPSSHDLQLLDLYARQAADFIEHVRHQEASELESRRKDTFFATLAHELRNPLAPIVTGLELMRMEPDLSRKFDEILAMLQRQVRHLTALADDLLDVSRITRGKLELKKRRVALADVVRDSVEASQSLVEAAEQGLSIQLPSDQVFLDADPNRLVQVFTNLLNNAAKYTPRGGSISLAARRQDHDVVIAVKDTGIGIPADMLERVFEMFAQLDRPIERSGDGLGIGLTLVKWIVELHGGTVRAFSEGVDKGSQFVVQLPTVGPEFEDSPAPRPGAPVATSASLRVLVVDDNKDAAKMLKSFLKSLGHEIRAAHDGQEAIDAAGEFRPDVILMDLRMPKVSGYDAAEQIRKTNWGKSVRMVALSGFGHDEERRKTKQVGFDHHLVKPVEPSALEELLARLASPPS
jgi:two-component system, chemotaxis family, CheB/CheR fusion protein